ncbi:MAG: hypothetical protein RL367_2512, partial [Pseudomonadota bacterium]
MMRVFTFILVPLALAGCGLQPLYSGGHNGAVAQTLTSVEIGPIDGKAGWLLRNALNDRMGRRGETAP